MLRGRINPETMDMNEFMFTPQKTTLIGSHHDLLYSRQPFYVQSPVCEILEFNKEHKTIKMQFSKEYNPESYQLFCGLNSLFFKYLSANYPDAKFISSVSCGHIITINAKIDPNIHYFDVDKNIIISDDISVGDLILCLLKTKGLWVNDSDEIEHTGTMKWNVFQLLNLKTRI